MEKVNHSEFAWKVTKNRMVLSDPRKRYAEASEEQKERGKARRRLEDLSDEKALQDYVSEIWDEH